MFRRLPRRPLNTTFVLPEPFITVEPYPVITLCGFIVVDPYPAMARLPGGFRRGFRFLPPLLLNRLDAANAAAAPPASHPHMGRVNPKSVWVSASQVPGLPPFAASHVERASVPGVCPSPFRP